MDIVSRVKECLHLWNIHVATIQPEYRSISRTDMVIEGDTQEAQTEINRSNPSDARMRLRVSCWSKCDEVCEEEVCCK